jgi:hypothetical protein
MDEIKDSLPGQTPPEWVKLTTEDVARLSGKREEMILVLRGWHGYGRLRADRAINNWLYNHGPTHTGRA